MDPEGPMPMLLCLLLIRTGPSDQGENLHDWFPGIILRCPGLIEVHAPELMKSDCPGPHAFVRNTMMTRRISQRYREKPKGN